MSVPTIKEIKDFVTKNSWLEVDDEGDDFVTFNTRENGDMENDQPGKQDIKKALEVGNALMVKYGDAVSAVVGYVDEWTDLEVTIEGKQESKRGMSGLLSKLEEAAKVEWKPLDVNGWELYSYEWEKGADAAEKKKRSKAAASALNKAMKEVAKEVSKLVTDNPYNEEWWGKKLGELYKKNIESVVREYRDTGMDDTEPRYHIAQGMINMVKNWYGIQGWTSLGDWL